MSKILLVVETGSDMPKDWAEEYGITIVPMHVQMGDQTLDDGAFPVSQMFNFYKETKVLPRTAGCTPHDFEVAFDQLQSDFPGRPILYLAYSASTTCSMQSATIAAASRENITIIDTKSVTAGQTAVVMRVARFLEANPDATVKQAAAVANEAIAKVRMGFFPGDLDYLRAGGRVSNAAYLGAKILSLHPLIEIQDGKLLSTKKYRGAMTKCCPKMAAEFVDQYDFDREWVYLIRCEGLERSIMDEAEQIMRGKGFQNIRWIDTGCVISAHSGPGGFGVAGFSK